jgi:hypothetical protein
MTGYRPGDGGAARHASDPVWRERVCSMNISTATQEASQCCMQHPAWAAAWCSTRVRLDRSGSGRDRRRDPGPGNGTR